MQIFPAIISCNKDNWNEKKSQDDFIRVRIPHFHGPVTTSAYDNIKLDAVNAENANHTEDVQLPYALINRGLDNKEFSAAGFVEGDIVYVLLENGDVNTPIILGYASRFSYTEDPEVAKNNLLYGSASVSNDGFGEYSYEDFEGANDVVRVAKAEAKAKVHDIPHCNVKYNTEYWGKTVNDSSLQWCAAFVWWVFKHAGMSKYYYGGKKTAHCKTLLDYYKQKNQFITRGYKAGDILFMNWSGNATPSSHPQHVGIVIEDQKSPTDPVKTVEGNTQGSGDQSTGGHVMYKTRQLNCIVGGARLGLPKSTTSSAATVEEQVYQFARNKLNFTKAGATALITNVFKESSFNLCTVGDHGTSFGLCQWHDTSPSSGRYTNLKNYCSKNNLDYRSVTGQMSYLKHELENSYKSVNKTMKEAPNTAEGVRYAAYYWCLRFEVPADTENTAQARGKFAVSEFWNKKGYKDRED